MLENELWKSVDETPLPNFPIRIKLTNGSFVWGTWLPSLFREFTSEHDESGQEYNRGKDLYFFKEGWYEENEGVLKHIATSEVEGWAVVGTEVNPQQQSGDNDELYDSEPMEQLSEV